MPGIFSANVVFGQCGKDLQGLDRRFCGASTFPQRTERIKMAQGKVSRLFVLNIFLTQILRIVCHIQPPLGDKQLEDMG